MKTMRTMLSFLFLCSLVFTSCKSHDQHQDPPSLTVDKSAITHVLSAGTESILINSNIDWKLNIPASASWLQVDKKSGSKGSTKVTFTFSENKAPQPLVTDLTLTANGVQDQKIHIVQNGTAAFINVDKNPIVIKPGDVEDSIIVTSNTDWKLDVPSSATWLTLDKTTGSAGMTKVHFTMPVNTSIDTLRTELSISSPSDVSMSSLKLKVQHNGINASLSVDKTSLIEKAEGQQDSIIVTSNTNWTLSIPTSVTWITADKTFGSAGSTKVFFTIENNTSNAVRTVGIGVNSGANNIEPLNIEIRQLAVSYTLNSFTPTSAGPGTDITLIGSFGTNPKIKLNDVNVAVKSSNANSIVFTVPDGATTGKIKVSFDEGVSLVSTGDLVVYSISDFSPTSGPVGTQVTVHGTFNSSVTPTVTLNSKPVTIVSFSSSQITIVIPNGAAEGKIEVSYGTSVISTASNFIVTGIWEKVSNDIGGVVGDYYGGVSFVYNHQIYYGINNLYGGLKIFNPTNNTWISGPSIASTMIKRGWATCFMINNKAYIGLGNNYNGSTSDLRRDWWEFDPSKNGDDAWKEQTAFNYNGMFAVGFSVNNNGYVSSPNYNTNLYLFDQTAIPNKWTPISGVSLPKADHISSFTIGSFAYLVGGRSSSSGSSLSNAYKFDPSNASFISIASAPIAFNNAPSFSLNGKGYILTNSSTYQYDPSKDEWIDIHIPNDAEGGLYNAAVVDGVAYYWNSKGTYKFIP